MYHVVGNEFSFFSRHRTILALRSFLPVSHPGRNVNCLLQEFISAPKRIPLARNEILQRVNPTKSTGANRYPSTRSPGVGFSFWVRVSLDLVRETKPYEPNLNLLKLSGSNYTYNVSSDKARH